MKVKKFISVALVLVMVLAMFPIQTFAAPIPPSKPDPVQTYYIPEANFAQISMASAENDATILRSGTTSTTSANSFTTNTAGYWSGVTSGGLGNVGSNRAFFMRVPVPTIDPAYLENPNFKVTLEFTIQNGSNLNASGHFYMTLFELTAAFPTDMSSMRSIGSSAATTTKSAYPYKSTAATSNRIPGSGVSGLTLSFDMTAYYKANTSAENWEFLMLPNNSMLDLYSASSANSEANRPRVVVDSGLEDARTPLEALTIEDTLYHGDKLPSTSRGESVTWSCTTSGQSGRVVNNTIAADTTTTRTVTLQANVGGSTRDFASVQIIARSASPTAEILIKGEDVDDANARPGAMTFKGFGLINGNATSDLLMDYKAQHPAKYWELMEILFGGSNPLFDHIKMEMGNDNDNSTGAEPATKRFADEEANAARSKGFQMTADAKKVNPDVKVSMLRWGVPVWVSVNEAGGTGSTGNSEKVREQFYTWYRDTMFDIYDRYGYVLDFINPDQNESGFVTVQMKYFTNRLRNENDFPSNWTAADKQKYRSMRIVGGDENSVPTSAADTIMGDAELMQMIDIMGYHYFTNGSASIQRLWEDYDFEIWYNEGCAIFGTMEGSANSAGGDAANAAGSIGGYQSPLAMIDGFMAGFIEDQARKSHYIFQPAIGGFYEGSQYSHKNLLSTTDPWSGYIHYDESLYLLAHFTAFSKAGWENASNTNGIWRMIDNASACWPGNANEHNWNQNGVPSYMTLAAPNKTQFSTVFVNNSSKSMFYSIELDSNMKVHANAQLAVWETKAGSYMKKRETLTKTNGKYWVAVEPFSMVTVTTQTLVTPVTLPADNARTPLDTDDNGKGYNTNNSILYADNFEYAEEAVLDIWNSKTQSSYKQGYLESRGGGMRYAVIKNGAFEARDGKLKQLLEAAPTSWNGSQPNLIVGDFRWMNYKASVDVDLTNNKASDSAAYGRLTIRQQIGPNGDDGSVNGYSLRVYRSGSWQLLRNGASVASGSVTGKDTFKLELEGADNLITGWIDGVQVVSYTDPIALYAGRVKLGTNWGLTEFDNLLVEYVPGYVPYATEFMDDGSSKLTYSGTGWTRTSGNGGGAENFNRSLSTKTEDGATLEFEMTGTGFALLGSNGNYSSAVMDVYVDNMATPYVTDAVGRNLSNAERHREAYMLEGLSNRAHKVKVVFKAGTFVMDGVTILGTTAPGSRNSASVTDNLNLAAAKEDADPATFLPAKVKVNGYDNGVPFTNRELDAVWETTSLKGKAWGSANINGKAMMGTTEVPLMFSVNLVVPGGMVYFIDAGTRDTATYTGGSDPYNAIKALFPELLNEVADRNGNGTASNIGTMWGSAPGTAGPVVVTGAQASNMFTSILYGSTNGAGADVNYDLEFTEPGIYALAIGFYQPWGARPVQVTASGTPIGETKILINSISVTSTPQTRSGGDLYIDVKEAGVVRLSFRRTTGDAAAVAWIGVNKSFNLTSDLANKTDWVSEIGAQSSAQQFEITSSNGAFTAVTASLASDENFEITAPLTVGQGGKATVSVRPKVQVNPGVYSTNLIVGDGVVSVSIPLTNTVPEPDLAPSLTGPTSQSLVEGYAQTDLFYTISGSGTVTVTMAEALENITWNDSSRRLRIATGLTAGEYIVTLTADNGIDPPATLVVTITVLPSYTVTFNAKGGSSVSPIRVAQGSSIEDEPLTSLDNYSIFLGWFTDDGTFENEVSFPYTPSGNITLYANFRAIGATELVVNFDSNGGTSIRPMAVSGAIADEPVTTRGEDVFGGWYLDNATFQNKVTFPYTPAGDVTLYAKWIVIMPSDDATLSDLTISSGTLSPEFSSDIVNYTATVANSVESITITAASNDPNAYVDGDGQVTLSEGYKTIYVIFTSEDPTTVVTYTITVIREEADSTPPVPGNSGTITTTNVAQNSLKLTWDKATDNVTEQTALKYYVYQKTSAFTMTGGQPDGTLLNIGGTADIATYNVTGLSASTSYYFIVMVEDESGNKASYTATSVTTSAVTSGNSGNSGSTGSTPTAPTPAPTPSAPLSVTVESTINTETGAARTEVKADALAASIKQVIENKTENQVITIEASIPTGVAIEALKSIEVTVNQTAFESIVKDTSASVSIQTPIAMVTFDNKALETIVNDGGEGNMSLVAAKIDTQALAEFGQLSQNDLKKIGGRPVYEFTVTKGDTEVSNFKGGKATINIPYTLQSGENPNAIVVYYIDADGKLKTMRGSYDSATGTVSVVTTHFSKYAVAYNPVHFNDVKSEWFADAVMFVAARDIITGVGNGNFVPNGIVTRGQFITMLLRAYNIEPVTGDNFADAGNTWYTGYLAAAKQRGISTGVGDNRFDPNREISREEMFTLLYNTLKAIQELPSGSGKVMADYSESGDISSWASEAVKYLVENGVVSGSNGKLDLKGKSTRAQMTQLLYNLLK